MFNEIPERPLLVYISFSIYGKQFARPSESQHVVTTATGSKGKSFPWDFNGWGDRAWKPVYPKRNQYIGSSRSQRIVYDNRLWVFTRRENAITQWPRGEETLENVFSIVCRPLFGHFAVSCLAIYTWDIFLDCGDTIGRVSYVCIVLWCLLICGDSRKCRNILWMYIRWGRSCVVSIICIMIVCLFFESLVIFNWSLYAE